ncbi:MAG: hypothetical protein U9M98_01540 [Patescibacteria group bacterium]|nr:hypothetical protein [Patescibacteria group bacterium]
MCPDDKDEGGRDLYISADGRVHTSEQDAVAANWCFEEAGGRSPCPDPDSDGSDSDGSDDD